MKMDVCGLSRIQDRVAVEFKLIYISDEPYLKPFTELSTCLETTRSFFM